MDILVLGGTQFFGKMLVHQLLDKGYSVTIATRGKTGDPFGERVKRIVVDRFNEQSLRKLGEDKTWDVIYDQICYAPDHAKIASEVFMNKVGKYIFTSSMAVYDAFQEEPFLEEDFDPYHYPLEEGGHEDFSYGEGKRAAEAYFFQKARFPVTAVRFPIVMGEEDYTERLLFHIEKIKQGALFSIRNKSSAMSYISAEEAAAFLAWLAEANMEGPVNACADGTISIIELISVIENTVNKKAQLKQGAPKSPYGYEGSKIMSTEKAKKAGFVFSNLHAWLPDLVRKLA